MIEIVVFPFENSIKYDEEFINVLEIENQKLFISIAKSFYDISIGEESEEKINIFKDDNIISFSKVATIIINPFAIELDDKKIVAKLQSRISEKLYQDIEKVEEFSKICQSLIFTIINIGQELDFEYTFNISPNATDIMKMIGLKVAFKKDATQIEKMLEYINIISTFEIYELIVLVNIKNYFIEEELLEIYKYAKYRKIELLLIESKKANLLDYERKIIIDMEYDEFVEKNK